jgi:hypothetical protein
MKLKLMVDEPIASFWNLDSLNNSLSDKTLPFSVVQLILFRLGVGGLLVLPMIN